jgi:Putative Flp pilus-assembly TadE/G-like
MFVGGLVAILAIAALVFDVGQALADRRIEQDAADAAALAGARYIPTSTGTYQGLCTDRTGGQISDAQLAQVNAACDVAAQYLAADHFAGTITVKYPPGPESVFSDLPNNLEVEIGSTRPSFFAGILGRATQSTGAMGVAANSSGYSLPYSLLSLDPHGCSVTKVTGTATVQVNGTVHVDSDCSSALLISGQGAVDAPSCDAVGQVKVSGGGTPCTQTQNGVQVSGDPLRELPVPSSPATLGKFVKMPGETKNPPGGCPSGSASSTVTAPLSCTFNSSFAGHSYRMYPGYYPGGFKLNAGTFYLEPGIYYIGGGGVAMGGNGATIISVDTGTTTFGGGVLFYNGAFDDSSYCTGGTTSGCPGDMSFNGSSAIVKLKPIQTTIYKNMIIFGDRDYPFGITMNGSSTNLDISGTVYAPTSLVKINGSGATSIAVQVIAYDFQVNGSGGQLTVTYASDAVFQLSGAGLVQ